MEATRVNASLLANVGCRPRVLSVAGLLYSRENDESRDRAMSRQKCNKFCFNVKAIQISRLPYFDNPVCDYTFVGI